MIQVASAKATCKCEHRGVIGLVPSQDWIFVDRVPLLVKGDFDRRPITLCTGGAEVVGVTRCTAVAGVDDARSHSAFVAIDGRGVALSSATGVTNWSQTLTASWSVADAGQGLLFIKEA
jgi:hypothetical protein